ncbi:MAG TPA: hypothetical protein VFT98_04205 [Myxococcota bacterium]|nr:hypothetical protein [Myxococcota bacterium]
MLTNPSLLGMTVAAALLTELFYANIVERAVAEQRFAEIALASIPTALARPLLDGCTLVVARGVARELQVGAWEMLREGVRAWPRLLAVNVFSGLFVGVASLFLVVPGLVLAVRYALASSAAFEDRCGLLASLQRSSELSRGRFWQIALTLGTLFGAVIAFSFLAELAAVIPRLEEVAWIPVTSTIGSDIAFSLVTAACWCVFATARAPATVGVDDEASPRG